MNIPQSHCVDVLNGNNNYPYILFQINVLRIVFCRKSSNYYVIYIVMRVVEGQFTPTVGSE